MASFTATGYTSLRTSYRDCSMLSVLPPLHNSMNYCYCRQIFLYPICIGIRRFCSTNTESTSSEFAGLNAYEILGVSETSSFAEIKASFRKLAKETHPDLAQSHNHPSAADRFVQILAAYEILSDSTKRAHYDSYLLCERTHVQRHSRRNSTTYKFESHRTPTEQMEVVEWLKWYRHAINDILSEKSIASGSGYFDVLERDLYSAIRAAYYGPEIESVDLLPDRFEAEERSVYETPDVLHLVSGRDLLGMVRLANRVPEVSYSNNEKLTSFASSLCQSIENFRFSDVTASEAIEKQIKDMDCDMSDTYKNLELHVMGRCIALAKRTPPKRYYHGIKEDDSDDHIHVYLTSHEDPSDVSKGFSRNNLDFSAERKMMPLGVITGLGTSPEEGSCNVFNNNGIKTHIIMKHRTLLVKHMHWYQLGDKVSVCECRCSRARLPPSKFWLFQPRSSMHDIGGWYVETFGRDKKGRAVPSPRFWDGLDINEHLDRRLHPAIYLLVLAYRTLDIEDARRRKQCLKNIVEANMTKIFSWCKRFI